MRPERGEVYANDDAFRTDEEEGAKNQHGGNDRHLPPVRFHGCLQENKYILKYCNVVGP